MSQRPRQDAVIAMAACGKSLFDRGYAVSTGASMSTRLGDGLLVTAADASLGRLTDAEFAEATLSGHTVAGPPPAEALSLHLTLYRARPDVNAVLHLHAPASLALSCLAEPTDAGNVLPAITPDAVRRVGRVPLVEYLAPGSPALGRRLGEACLGVNAVLLQNQGLVAFAGTLGTAVAIAEAIEQTIHVWLMTDGHARTLTDDEIAPLGGGLAPGMQRPKLVKGVKLGW